MLRIICSNSIYIEVSNRIKRNMCSVFVTSETPAEKVKTQRNEIFINSPKEQFDIATNISKQFSMGERKISECRSLLTVVKKECYRCECHISFVSAYFQRYTYNTHVGTFYPWIYDPAFVQAFYLLFDRSFNRSSTFLHSLTDCQEMLVYLSIQLLCHKTYDYYFFDVPTFRYLITWQKQRASAFWFIDLYSIFCSFVRCCTINTYFIVIGRLVLLTPVLSAPTLTHTHTRYK